MKGTVPQIIAGLICALAVGFIVAAQLTRFWVIAHWSDLGTIEYGLYHFYQVYPGISVYYGWSASGPDLTVTNRFLPLNSLICRSVLLGVDALVATAIVVGVIGFFTKGKTRMRCFISSGAFNIIAGILTVIVAIVYLGLVLTAFFSNTITISNTPLAVSHNMGFSYSFCWIAAILLITAGSIQIAAASQQQAVVHPSKPVIYTTQLPPPTITQPPPLTITQPPPPRVVVARPYRESSRYQPFSSHSSEY